MKITIVGRQMTVRDDMKELVNKKLAKLDKFFADDATATVTFSRKRGKENLEVTISAGGILYRSEEEDETFQSALDRSMEAIERQIRKNKTRLEKRLRSGAFVPDAESRDFGSVEEEPEFSVRVKTFPFKPMSVEEAILQMNLLEHQFFVFEDSKTGDTCVVYARRDGQYGLIVPQK